MMQAAAPRIVPGNAQNRGDRDYQEDAFGFSGRNDPAFVRHAGVAAVLCDGMGGLQFGAESASLAVDTFLGEYRRKLPDEAPGAALQRAAHRANDAVFRFARENGVVQRTGCTLVAVVARGVELHCIHAGDSRAYLFSGGRLERLTVDHTYARRLELQVEQGQLSPQEAAEHPNRDHLTSNLGRQDLNELDLLDPPRKLAPGDWVLLCSDGLHGVLSDREIVAELHGDSQDAAQRLVQRVTDRPLPEKDNVTVVLMRVGADGALQSSHHTWKTGKPVRDRASTGSDSAQRDTPAGQPRASAQPKTTPPWVWAMTSVPLILALAAWLFWPSPKPQAPVVSGFEQPTSPTVRPEASSGAGNPPAVPATVPVNAQTPAPVLDLPSPPLVADKPKPTKSGDTKAAGKGEKPGGKQGGSAKTGQTASGASSAGAAASSAKPTDGKPPVAPTGEGTVQPAIAGGGQTGSKLDAGAAAAPTVNPVDAKPEKDAKDKETKEAKDAKGAH